MSNRQYITKAVVCGSTHHMTSDKSYLLFTEDLGMLWAHARSVRMEKSKQRYALQDFSILRVSLIQGKTTWRIGSVEAITNPFFESLSRQSRGGVSFVLKTLRSYVHGEGVGEQVFSDIVLSMVTLAQAEEMSDIYTLQQVFTARLLYVLGYIKKTDTIKAVLEAESVTDAAVACNDDIARELSVVITHAQEVSHL